MMATIKGRDTKPEVALRRALHARGFRFRMHVKNVHGRPDLLFPKYQAVTFVHGCFWHRHSACFGATTPKTRQAYWRAKFAANVQRDQKVSQALADDGWTVMVIWECETRDSVALADILRDRLGGAPQVP